MADETPPADPTSAKFTPICAIGASAGGVSALQSLFRQLPTDLGLAYVVIVHLSPDQPSALGEVLAACTRMSVNQVQDGPALEPNCVYVIAPDRELGDPGRPHQLASLLRAAGSQGADRPVLPLHRQGAG